MENIEQLVLAQFSSDRLVSKTKRGEFMKSSTGYKNCAENDSKKAKYDVNVATYVVCRTNCVLGSSTFIAIHLIE